LSRRHWVDNEEMMRVMTALYYGAITHVDDQLGRLFGELGRLGMADNTLVLFTADHGNMLGERGRWFKGLQYDGSARVPLLWKEPGNASLRGRVVNETVDTTDLLPSILDYAGLPVPEGVQGSNFRRLAAGGDRRWRNSCFSQLRSGMWLEGGWKLIENSLDGSGSRELYDLKNDPKEERDLAYDPRQRDRVQHGMAQMARMRAERPAPLRISGMATPAYAQVSEEERQEAWRNAPDNRDEGAAAPRRQRK
jgi:arylsulfatase A-like enzyme